MGLARIDAVTGKVSAVYSGLTGGGVAISEGALWVTDNATNRLYRIPSA